VSSLVVTFCCVPVLRMLNVRPMSEEMWSCIKEVDKISR
jgi:hypothetical protein